MFDLPIQISASLLTIAGQFHYGNKRLLGPILGIVSQVPWWTIMFMHGLWGLLPVNLMLLIIHTRNFIKWKRESQ